MAVLIQQPIEREIDTRVTVDTVSAALGTLSTNAVLAGGMVANDIKRVIQSAYAVLQDTGTVAATVVCQKASPGGAVATIGTCTLGGTGTDGTATAPKAFTFTDTAIAVGDTVTFKVTAAGTGTGNLLVRMNTARDYS